MTDTAPRDTAPKPVKVTAPKRADRKPSTGRKKSLKKPLADLFTNVGTGVALINQADGLAIINGADNLADALNNVAKDNDAVYRNLERMVTGSAWGGVFMALGGILLPIAMNHNLLPFQIPGVEVPATGAESKPESVPDIGANVSAAG
jgi:hypothetical protein